MNDELCNDQDDFAEPNNKAQINNCDVCKKNPCVCPDKGGDSHPEAVKMNPTNDEKLAKTKPPKTSWI